VDGTRQLRLRAPLAVRVWLIAFGILWCGLLAWIVVLVAPRPAAVIPALILMFGGAFIFRLSAVTAATDGEWLTIRNVYRTWRIPRSGVTGFRLGRDTATPFGYVVFALTDDEIVSLDVSRTPTRSGRVRRQLAVLEDWRDAESAPSS
jgi:hypothetical protein